LVAEYTQAPDPDEWDLDALWNELKRIYPVSITAEDVIEEAGGQNRVTAEMLVEELTSDIHLAYERREEELTPEIMRQLERRVVLSVLDRKWREHLYEMDYLKEGIGLRAMGQRDPLVEYQREGYHLFEAMNEAIKEESVQYLFNLEVKVQEPEGAPQQAGVTADAAAQTAAGAPLGATANAAQAAGAGAGAGSAQGRRAGARSTTANRGGGAALAAAARDGQ